MKPLLCLVAALLLAPLAGLRAAESKPNIVYIMADDIGYGDLGCYGATKVKTPHVDRLASQGLRFTDGHCTSATCTPSRYGFITGRYPWRQAGTGVLSGEAALIVEPGSLTTPAMLKRAGYATACVGKWHLGLGSGDLDWNTEIKPGPLEVGFDYSFIVPATGDRVPCVYVEDHRVANLDPRDPIAVSYRHPVGDEPTGRAHPELLKMKLSQGHDGVIVNGVSRIGFMSGGMAARWNDQDMADTLARKSIAFIERAVGVGLASSASGASATGAAPTGAHSRSAASPFFLYLATHDIHVPRTPNPRFVGSSGCGIRGDAIAEFDDTVGQVLAAIDRLGLADNTLVILSSDNGPVVDDGYADGAEADLNGHLPAGPLRGGKYWPYEGGTRVPLIVRWPARVKPGVSSALVCQIDLLASLAALVEQPLTSIAAPSKGPALDSQNVLAALLGESSHGRDSLVEQSGGPAGLSLRDGPWKLVPVAARRRRPEAPTGGLPELYDLQTDLGETTNLAQSRPDVTAKMERMLKETVGDHPIDPNPRPRQ